MVEQLERLFPSCTTTTFFDSMAGIICLRGFLLSQQNEIVRSAVQTMITSIHYRRDTTRTRIDIEHGANRDVFSIEK